MKHLKKICETDACSIDFHWFHVFLSFSFLQMRMLQQLKMRHLDKFLETIGGQIKEQDDPLT